MEAPVPLTRARAPTGVRICVQSTVTVKDALESMKNKHSPWRCFKQIVVPSLPVAPAVEWLNRRFGKVDTGGQVDMGFPPK